MMFKFTLVQITKLLSKVCFNLRELRAFRFFNGIKLPRILTYAVLTAVFYSKRTWKECFFIGKAKENQVSELQKLYWNVKLTMYNIQKLFQGLIYAMH